MTIKKSTLNILVLFAGLLFCITSCDIYPAESQETENYNQFQGLEQVKGAEKTKITIHQGSAVGRDAYFEFEIENIESDIIASGVYEGWCIEWTKPIAQQGDTYENIQMYSTYGKDKWKPLNYFLNIKDELKKEDPDLTYKEFQAVIWTIAEGPEFDLNTLVDDKLPPRLQENGKPNFSKEKAIAIAKDIRSKSSSFEYSSDSQYAMFMKTDDDDQDIMFPTDPPDSVSHGYVDGVTPSDDPRFAERTYPVVQADWDGPGGDKLWLGWNLGATEEPTTSSYNNPGAAGWYFHFNRLQAHYAQAVDTPDSDIIIPGTNDAAFSEDSEWIVENDPCRELLGDTWRIPTVEEWRSFLEAPVDDNGMNNGGQEVAFNSALELHTTGFVRYFRGINLDATNAGFYWSSEYQEADTEGMPTPGKILFFDEFESSVGDPDQSVLGREHAAPLRCIEN